MVDLNISNKSDLLSSFEKIFGCKATDKMEGGLFATSLWSFLTSLDDPRKRFKRQLYFARKGDRWMFDNAIITDGISVSFQIIKSSEFGRKERFKKKETIQSLPEPTTKSSFDKETKFLAVDPGKQDILAVTDGKKTICYTLGQRNKDTFAEKRKDYLVERRRCCGLEEFETTILNQFTKRSCIYQTFKSYCVAKEDRKLVSQDCYNHPALRQFKFLVYCNTKSSENKFMAKVKKTFVKSNTVSKPCNTEAISSNAEKSFTIHKHHLLRCTNELCHSRWWNRNVVGSFNILDRLLNLVHR